MLLSVCLSLPQQQTSSKKTSTVSHLQQQQQQPSAIDMALHHHIFSSPLLGHTAAAPNIIFYFFGATFNRSQTAASEGERESKLPKLKQQQLLLLVLLRAPTARLTLISQSAQLSSAQFRQIGSQSISHTHTHCSFLDHRPPLTIGKIGEKKKETQTNDCRKLASLLSVYVFVCSTVWRKGHTILRRPDLNLLLLSLYFLYPTTEKTSNLYCTVSERQICSFHTSLTTDITCTTVIVRHRSAKRGGEKKTLDFLICLSSSQWQQLHTKTADRIK